jgi:uncharacterized spore protein YtfJ
MKIISGFLSAAAYAVCWAAGGHAQPLAKPLADFDKMVSELKSSSVVGEPIRAGDTTVIPFARVQFGLGSAGAKGGVVGGVGAQTVPLGVVIVSGDEVRVDLLEPQEEKTPAVMRQLTQSIIDRKVSFMVNGLNIGNATGDIADLTPMITGLMGQTMVIVNGLNLGNLNAPRPATSDAGKTAADLESIASKNPTPENYYKLGEALRKGGEKEKAAAAYQKAIDLRPGYSDAVRALARLNE